MKKTCCIFISRVLTRQHKHEYCKADLEMEQMEQKQEPLNALKCRDWIKELPVCKHGRIWDPTIEENHQVHGTHTSQKPPNLTNWAFGQTVMLKNSFPKVLRQKHRLQKKSNIVYYFAVDEYMYVFL